MFPSCTFVRSSRRLLAEAPCRRWLAPVFVGQQLQELNMEFYGQLEKGSQYRFPLAADCAPLRAAARALVHCLA